MKYTRLNQLNQPLDFRSKFTYNGQKKSFDEIVYETLNSYEVSSSQSKIDIIISASLTCLSFLLFVCTLPVSAYFAFKLIHQYERMVVYRNGRLRPLKGPGIVFILPCVDKYWRVDMRTKAFHVPPTNIRTTDGCIISVGAIVHFRVRNPLQMTLTSQNVNQAVRDASKASMANLLSKRSFHDIKTKKLEYSLDIQAEVNLQTHEWGVELDRMELSELTLIVAPPEKHSMFMPMYGVPQTPSMSTLGQLVQVGQQLLQQNFAAQDNNENKATFPVLEPSVISMDCLFQQVCTAVNEKLVEEVGVIYEFNISGPESWLFYVDLKNKPGRCAKGQFPGGEPDVKISLTQKDLQLLMSQELTPYNAYASNKLHISGKLELAMKLDRLLDCLPSVV